MPRRIQRRRTKGWRMPEGAVYVGRPTVWGNPWTLAEFLAQGFNQAEAERICVEAYRAWLLGHGHWAHARVFARAGGRLPTPPLAPLAGKDLACWCTPDQPWCHADALLEVVARWVEDLR